MIEVVSITRCPALRHGTWTGSCSSSAKVGRVRAVEGTGSHDGTRRNTHVDIAQLTMYT